MSLATEGHSDPPPASSSGAVQFTCHRKVPTLVAVRPIDWRRQLHNSNKGVRGGDYCVRYRRRHSSLLLLDSVRLKIRTTATLAPILVAKL